MADIKYVEGFPTHVYEIEREGEWQGLKKAIAADKLEKGKKIEDYNEWSYQGSDDRIDLVFDRNKDRLIAINCYSADKLYRCPTLGGIQDGDSGRELFRKFGQRYTSSIDGVTKVVTYPSVGAHFYLTQETIYMLGINDTEYGWPPRTNAGGKR